MNDVKETGWLDVLGIEKGETACQFAKFGGQMC